LAIEAELAPEAKFLATNDKSGRAANIAKLPELLKPGATRTHGEAALRHRL